MKTAADNHGGGDVRQQRWIRQQRRCGTETEEMWDDGDGKMDWKDRNGLGKYQQGMTTNKMVYRHSDDLVMVAMTDLHSNLV